MSRAIKISSVSGALTVTITGPNGGTPTVYTGSALTTTQTMPATVGSGATSTFWLQGPGAYTLSVKAGGIEIASDNNQTRTVDLELDGSVAALNYDGRFTHRLEGDSGRGSDTTDVSAAFSPSLKGLSTPYALRAIKAALDSGQSFGITVLSDSTGVSTSGNRWPYLLCADLAARYPTYTVHHQAWNDTNQNYDAPTVIQTGAGNARSITPGTQNAYVPASVIAQPAGDLDVRVQVSFAAWPPAATSVLATHGWNTGQFSWRFAALTSGGLSFRWSGDGTANNFPGSSVLSGASLPAVGTPIWLRATFQTNNGGNRVVAFYTSLDGSTWTSVGGSSLSLAGTGTLATSTDDWEIGAEGFNSNVLNGTLYAVQILDGIGGTPLSPLVMDGWQLRSQTTATRAGAPKLLMLNASKSGAGVTYLNDVTRLPKMMLNNSPAAVILSNSHNDGALSGNSYLASWDTWLTRIKATQSEGASLVVCLQNPETSAATASGGQPDAHLRRRWHIGSWARRNALAVVDVFQAFTDDARGLGVLLNADGLHPSDSDGSPLWETVIAAAIGF